MKHVSLDAQDESVRRFVLALTVNPEGSLLELDGQPVAYVVRPPQNGARKMTKSKKDAWTEAKNNRRCDLIDKEIDGTLTAPEAIDLHDLQQEMLDYRRRVAPLPIEAARALHRRLLSDAKDSERQE